MHSSPLSLIKKHHPLIRLFAAGGQALGETADVQLQLVAIGIEEVVRSAFATVQLPDRHAGNLKASGEAGEIRFADGKRIMGVVALLRRSDTPLRIQRQAPTQFAAGELGAAVPAGVQRQARQLLLKRHARRQLADRQGQVIPSAQHVCSSSEFTMNWRSH